MTTKDIANDAVTSKKIKDGQVKAGDLGKGIPYDSGPPVGGESASNSQDKTLFVECDKGKTPVTGGAFIEGGEGYVALTESHARPFRPATPRSDGWPRLSR